MTDFQTIKSNFDLFNKIQLDTELRRKGSYWVGPCPFCGGDDRFTVKIERGEYKWFCRVCGDGIYHDAIDYVMRRNNLEFKDAVELMGGNLGELPDRDPAEMMLRRIQLEQEQQRRQNEIDAKIAKFTTEEIWLALHRRLDDQSRQWWRDQGIPDNWQNDLLLGFMPEKLYKARGGELRKSPAYTIPYFHNNGNEKKFCTIQYRLTDPENPADRYRFEYDLGSTFYDTKPDEPLQESVIICEGAKKGIVTKIYAGNGIKVLSIPAKNDFGGVVEAITNQVKRVYVILDPDGYDRPPNASVNWIPPQKKLALEIGSRARVVDLPMKVDDAILHGMPKDIFINYLKQGIKLSSN